MKVGIRHHRGQDCLVLDWMGTSYDVTSFVRILAQSRHPLSPQAKTLASISLPLDNILTASGASDYLQAAEELIGSYLLNGDPWQVQAAVVPEDAPFRAPIRKPPLMFGLAGNCPNTWRGTGVMIPDYPVGYTRPWRSLSAHCGVVTVREPSSFRCATELGVVIGKEAYRVSKEQAWDYIFGFTVVNDMISNHWKQFASDHHPSHKPSFMELLITSYYGRGTDGFAPVGPYIVSKEAVGDPYNLLVYTSQNGVQRDRSYTNAMVVGIEDTIQYLSSFMPLYPGSIIHMGTMGVDGITVGDAGTLAAGDYVDMEIERVGTLRTYFHDVREL